MTKRNLCLCAKKFQLKLVLAKIKIFFPTSRCTRGLGDSQGERRASCSYKTSQDRKKKREYEDGHLDKSLSARAARHSGAPWSDTFLIAARSFAWKQFGYRLRWLQWHSGRNLARGEKGVGEESPRGDPWDPMGSTESLPPTVCGYVSAHACMRGPWHGAQLGGPIPLTRSQHPSFAIIPLGGSLAKDLIKYCYTRNLIPLRTLSRIRARYSSLPFAPSSSSASRLLALVRRADALHRNARSVAPPVRSSWERVASRAAKKSRCLRRYLSRARVPYLRRVSLWIVQVDLWNILCVRFVCKGKEREI